MITHKLSIPFIAFWRLGLIVALLLAPISPLSAFSPSAVEAANGITLYRDINYGGISGVFIADDANLSDNPIGSDQVTSVGILGPYYTILYRDINYAGISEGFCSSDQDLSDNSVASDNVSSLRVYGLLSPTPSAPANGSNVSGTSVTFSWMAAACAASYHLQVSTSSNFASLFYDGTIFGVSQVVNGFSNSGTTYYWHVQTCNGGGACSAYTGPQSFVNGGSLPGTPGSPAPSNGATNQSVYSSTSWNATNATTYDVYFEPNDSTPDVLLCSNIASRNCNPGTLQNNTTYYWKVVAKNSYGQTIGSIWNFTTGGGYSAQILSSPGSQTMNANSALPLSITYLNNASNADGDWGPGAAMYALDETTQGFHCSGWIDNQQVIGFPWVYHSQQRAGDFSICGNEQGTGSYTLRFGLKISGGQTIPGSEFSFLVMVNSPAPPYSAQVINGPGAQTLTATEQKSLSVTEKNTALDYTGDWGAGGMLYPLDATTQAFYCPTWAGNQQVVEFAYVYHGQTATRNFEICANGQPAGTVTLRFGIKLLSTDAVIPGSEFSFVVNLQSAPFIAIWDSQTYAQKIGEKVFTVDIPANQFRELSVTFTIPAGAASWKKDEIRLRYYFPTDFDFDMRCPRHAPGDNPNYSAYAAPDQPGKPGWQIDPTTQEVTAATLNKDVAAGESVTILITFYADVANGASEQICDEHFVLEYKQDGEWHPVTNATNGDPDNQAGVWWQIRDSSKCTELRGQWFLFGGRRIDLACYYRAKWLSQSATVNGKPATPDKTGYLLVAPGDEVVISARFYNSSETETWKRDEVFFATYKDPKAYYPYKAPRNAPENLYCFYTSTAECQTDFGKSYFKHSSWSSDYRITTVENDVQPGQEATFILKFKIPDDITNGLWREDFSMAAGYYWIDNPENGDPFGVAHIWVGFDVSRSGIKFETCSYTDLNVAIGSLNNPGVKLELAYAPVVDTSIEPFDGRFVLDTVQNLVRDHAGVDNRYYAAVNGTANDGQTNPDLCPYCAPISVLGIRALNFFHVPQEDNTSFFAAQSNSATIYSAQRDFSSGETRDIIEGFDFSVGYQRTLVYGGQIIEGDDLNTKDLAYTVIGISSNRDRVFFRHVKATLRKEA
jgi:hypothetical protein